MNGQDLNEGAGGDFIYACQKLSNEPADKNSALTRIGVVGAWESDEVRNFCTRPNEKRIRYGGYVPYDLNKGAGGAYIYFCSPGPPHDLQVSRIKAIAFVVYSWPGPTELCNRARTGSGIRTTAQVARAGSSPPFTTRAQAAFRAATSTRARAGSSSIPASTGATDSGRSLGPRSRFVSPPAGEDRG